MDTRLRRVIDFSINGGAVAARVNLRPDTKLEAEAGPDSAPVVGLCGVRLEGAGLSSGISPGPQMPGTGGTWRMKTEAGTNQRTTRALLRADSVVLRVITHQDINFTQTTRSNIYNIIIPTMQS